jgi:hypothetical protein
VTPIAVIVALFLSITAHQNHLLNLADFFAKLREEPSA